MGRITLSSFLSFFSSICRLHLLLLCDQFKGEFVQRQYNKRITIILKKKEQLFDNSFRFFFVFFCWISAIYFLFTLYCQLCLYKSHLIDRIVHIKTEKYFLKWISHIACIYSLIVVHVQKEKIFHRDEIEEVS